VISNKRGCWSDGIDVPQHHLRDHSHGSLFHVSVNVSLTVTLMVPIAILLIYVNLNTRKLHQYYRQAQECYSEMTAKVQENFSGIRVIKAYCQEEEELERFVK